LRSSSRLGKVSRDFLEDVVFKNLGAQSKDVVVGPGHGCDNAVVSIGENRVLLVTTDPLSIIPQLGMKESAWLTVHLLASDLTTSGVRPQFAALDFDLPPELELLDFATYIREVSDECKRLGIAIVGGHTGRYPGSGFTVVGGGALFSTAGKDEYVTPAMAKEGDAVIVTKGAAIATTGVLARAFPNTVREKLGEGTLRKARLYLRSCSTVKEALIAASVGLRDPVTSMHDATEGGVLGGLFELSSACGKRILVSKEAIHLSEETADICSLFKLDALTSLSEGSLIITCASGKADELLAKLSSSGIESHIVGNVRESGRGLWVSSSKGRPERFVAPQSDPYWAAYARAMENGWD
jgi:hydrogenase expression/formation protein HypE